MKKSILIAFTLPFIVNSTYGQTLTPTSHMTAYDVPDIIIPFSITAKGDSLPMRWGLDTAWLSEGNVLKGIHYIGTDNLSVARLTFTPSDALNDGKLTATQSSLLRQRLNIVENISSNVDIMLTADQESLTTNYSKNNRADVDAWAALIDTTVEYIKAHNHAVIGVAPFNEPDYTSWGEGTISDLLNISKTLKEDHPIMEDVPIMAGNTLNCDNASTWYNYCKAYATIGNTHQLAGSFDNYASFFELVKADGNTPMNDELHNVGEAIIGAEYGMEIGIWWGWDGIARGQFCRASNNGTRLAYAEDRSRWTAAAVYRNDVDNRIEGFVGTSERQADKCSFLFVSKDKDVYYDGNGPTREFLVRTPGSTSYQVDQSNAERYLNITFGEDVQPSAINGRYIIMNKNSLKVLSIENGSQTDGANVCLNSDSGAEYQQWDVIPVDSARGGDFSYYDITSAMNGYKLDVLNWSLDASANIICYNGYGGNNEQWRLEYAGDGYYYIISHESNLYLCSGSSKSEGVNVMQGNKSDKDMYLWRILPVGTECETTAPSAPTGLKAKANSASVRLSWNANDEEDVAGYMILRAEEGTEDWNTIARKVDSTIFIDNTCEAGVTYAYKIKAIDKAENMSECSSIVTCNATNDKTLIAQWQLDESLIDNSSNRFDAVMHGTPSYDSSHKSGSQSLSLNGSDTWLQLPYALGFLQEMTFCAWVYWKGGTNAWERIFDFGTGTGSYMFLTPNDGSEMRFAIKGDDAEQILNATTKLPSSEWIHVSIVMGENSVSLYLDGKLEASSDEIVLRPVNIKPIMNYIGRSQYVADPLFNGLIDDIRIYNYALDEEEIGVIMNDLVNQVCVESSSSNTTNTGAIYNLAGMRIDNFNKGINIIHTTDGAVRRVLHK